MIRPCANLLPGLANSTAPKKASQWKSTFVVPSMLACLKMHFCIYTCFMFSSFNQNFVDGIQKMLRII